MQYLSRTRVFCLLFASMCLLVRSASTETLYRSEIGAQCLGGYSLNKGEVPQSGTPIATSAASLGKIVVDSPTRQLFWINGTKIRRGDLDGAASSDVVTVGTGYSLRGLALDSARQKVYWGEKVGCAPCGTGACPNCPRIRRANYDGTIQETLVPLSGFNNLSDVAVDSNGQKMYWSDTQFAPFLSRADLDGANVEPLVSSVGVGVGGIDAILTDSTSLYWLESASGIPGNQYVRRAQLDGTDPVAIATYIGVSLALRGLTLDAACGMLYYSLGGYCPLSATADVFRVNTETLASERIYAQINLVTGLAVEPGADSDGDGTPNCKDGCPDDSGKITPGVCGCGVVDSDGESNGIVDCLTVSELRFRLSKLAAIIEATKKTPNKKQARAIQGVLSDLSTYAATHGDGIGVQGNLSLGELVTSARKLVAKLKAGSLTYRQDRKRALKVLGTFSTAVVG